MHLALLEFMLPGMIGFDLCKKIRETYTFPVIMLTAKVEDIDKNTGLTIVRTITSPSPFILWSCMPGLRPRSAAIPAISRGGPWVGH